MWISETLTAVFGQISFITENRRTKTKFCVIYQSLWIKSVSPRGCRRPKAAFCTDAPSSPASRQWCWLWVGSCRLVRGFLFYTGHKGHCGHSRWNWKRRDSSLLTQPQQKQWLAYTTAALGYAVQGLVVQMLFVLPPPWKWVHSP